VPIDISSDSIQTAIAKLKARETVLRQLESVSGLGSWEIDLNTKKSIWSDKSYEIYGIKKGTPANLELFISRLLPEYIPPVQKAIADIISSSKPANITCKALHSSGKVLTLLLNAQVIYDEEKKPLKIIGTTLDITEQTSIQEEAHELSQLLKHSSNEIYILDFETLTYMYVNQGAINALGYTSDELLTMNVADINPYLQKNKIRYLKKLLTKQDFILNRSIHRRKDQTEYHVQSYLHSLQYKNRKAYVIFDTDITETIELEMQYKKQAKILEYIHDSVISTDTDGKIISWNRGSTSLFNSTPHEMIGKSILDIYDVENKYSLEELFSIINTRGSIDIEAFMLRKDKTKVICDISLSMLKNEDDQCDGYIGYIQDITEKREIQLRLNEQTTLLKYQANHDALTGLPNRTLFADRLSQAIISSKRLNEKFALLFIDLDQFKKINDSLGHHIGDEVLVEASHRLQGAIRENDTLSRLGGDEFTVILKDIKNSQSAAKVAQKLVDVMNLPIQSTLHKLHITSSIGISIYPDDATNESNLIKYADVAMYRAKDEGRNNYQFYSSDMTALAFERVVMESSLRIAIKEEQFVVHYQPQIDTTTQKTVSMEALVRWQHPSLGLIAPFKFIPLAEESGLIIQIDRLVMKMAMKQFTEWQNMGLNPGLVSLNLAMKQLNTKDFIEYLKESMKEFNFQASWLELEVTEGDVMANPEASILKLQQLHALGISIAIDDFGTGYSSLSYLKKLPLDKLKIDRSFIKDIPDDEDDMAITRAIIALAKSLKLTLIAEGVETKEQKKFIVENGCELIQGYYYSQPLCSDDMQKFLETN